jgi:hypothetical protein
MAATHTGHCQICGRQHKVTGTRIAKHGFTIRFGWQEGACFGSGGKPYELSNDLLLRAIESAKRYIADTNVKIRGVKARPVDEEGYVKARVAEQRYSPDTYYTEVKITEVDGKIEARTRSDRRVFLQDAPRHKEELAKVIEIVSGKYVAYLQHTVKETQAAIPHMQERHDSWKLAELTPISAEEAAASAPKVHYQVKRYGYTTTACSASATASQRNASRIKTTDASKVTCAACAKEAARLAAKAAAAT